MLDSSTRDLLQQHPYKEDYQLLLNEAIQATTDTWQRYDGIIPFAVVLLMNGEVAFIGGPAQIPNGSIGIVEWIIRQLQQDRSSYRAIVLIQLTRVQKQDIIQAELEHHNGPALRAFYPLPNSDHWWVEQYHRRVWI